MDETLNEIQSKLIENVKNLLLVPLHITADRLVL